MRRCQVAPGDTAGEQTLRYLRDGVVHHLCALINPRPYTLTILLMHIDGKKEKGRQVKAMILEESVRGFCIAADGSEYTELV